jgi:hypothetical protein
MAISRESPSLEGLLGDRPIQPELRREFKEPKKYDDFLKADGARKIRRK